MTAVAWGEEEGPRAVREDAHRQALAAYAAASAALAEGEDADEHMERAHEQNARYLAAVEAAIPDRPKRGWLGLMCRGLGDLPDVPMPTAEEFPAARRYRVLPYLSILVPLSLLAVVITVLPLAVLSPVTATGRAIGGGVGQTIAGQIVTFTLAAVCTIFLVVVGPKRVKEFLFQAALDEELFFRLGAENWSPWQRIRACLQFGVAHLVNLFVAVATLGALALVGGIFMWVYLRELRGSGDQRRAVVVAAHFHATYNWGAIMFLLVGALLSLTLYLLPLVL